MTYEPLAHPDSLKRFEDIQERMRQRRKLRAYIGGFIVLAVSWGLVVYLYLETIFKALASV